MGIALVLVLFTFGGWNEVAYVAAEVRHPERTITRSLLLGLLAVTTLYTLANMAFYGVLGHADFVASSAVAVDTVGRSLLGGMAWTVGLLISLSALGAMHGLILTGARISYAVGQEHRLFQPLGVWSPAWGTPVRALMLQACIALAMIVLLGSFTQTLIYAAPVVYTFYIATSLSVIVLRHKAPELPRPYRVWGYPWTVLLFVAACLFMTYSAVNYRPRMTLISVSLMLTGVPLYAVSRICGPVGRREGE